MLFALIVAARYKQKISIVAIDDRRSRFELKCPPSIEASIYAQGETAGAFAPPPVPALLLSARSSRFGPAHAQLAAAAPQVELHEIDAGHLMPMEQPAAIARAIAVFVQRS